MARSLDLLPASFGDFRRKAAKRLPRFLFDYIDGGSGAEVTLRRNTADWEAVQLTQKVLHDATRLDCAVDLFGERLEMPLVLAPVGMGGMTARRGEVQAKWAADKAGIPFCLSTVGICSLEEVGSVSDRPAWFQLYMLKDRAVVKEILDNAWALGVRTLAFTIDLNVLGTRYRDIRNGMAGGLGLWGKLRSGPIDFALHPRWAFDVGLFGRPHGLGNLTAYVKGGSHTRDFQRWVGAQFDSSVTWKDIEWLRSVWKGNLLLKGILDIEDARQAVALGADGMVVSNHGGRQLDGVASTAVMLPRIADAVGSETVLLVDGGIRTGQDLVRALALGARAALIGRPWAMAMAAGGEAALSRYLDLVRTDMRVAMALSGVSTAGAIDRAIIFDA